MKECVVRHSEREKMRGRRRREREREREKDDRLEERKKNGTDYERACVRSVRGEGE